MSALPIITVTKKGEEIKTLPVGQDISVGRGDGCVIRLDDKAISRQHALFKKVGDEIQVEKRSEFAPLIVNGEDCTRRVLQHGDVVEMGPYRIKVSIPETPKPVEEPEQRHGPIGVATIDGGKIGDAVEASNVINFQSDNSQAESPSNIDFSFDHKKSLKRVQSDNDSSRAIEINGASATATFSVNAPEAGEDDPTRIHMRSIEAKLEIPVGYANVTEFDLAEGAYVIGRGKGSDLVLTDKKSSRKNTEIRKEGNRFIVRDLDSANGTFVNGKPIKEQELNHDDIVRVGEVQIRFVALNKVFEKKKGELGGITSEVPSVSMEMGTQSSISSPLAAGEGTDARFEMESGPSPLSQPIAPMAMDSHFGGMGVDPGLASETGEVPPDQEAPAPEVSERKGIFKIYDRYIKNFKTLKPIQKVLVVSAVIMFGLWYMEEDLVPQTANQPNPAATAAAAVAAGTTGGVKTYDTLPTADQEYVDTQMKIANDAYQNQDYDKALFEIGRVFQKIPDYPAAKELEYYVKRGRRIIEAQKAENAKKEEEAKMKARVAELVESARAAMEAKDYSTAEELFDEIVSLDPENGDVDVWRKEIEAVAEEQRRQEMEKRVVQETNQMAEEIYREGMALQKAGQYHDAIDTYHRVLDANPHDKRIIANAKKQIKASERTIRAQREPLLEKAREAEKAGDFSTAYSSFEEATRVDPPHREGYKGMERIRDILEGKARTLYTDGVIAESYSDFKGAHAKFNEILKTAPKDSIYFERAERKLKNYEHYQAEET